MEFDINKNKIEIEKDGKLVACDILFTFASEETMKVYVGYTDHSMKDGREMMYVSAIDMNNPKENMELITDPKDFEIIHEALMKMDEEVNKQEGM